MVFVKGFNSDICFQGSSYHVQTEDWGQSKSSIETKVFKNGAVMKTVTSNYKDFISNNLKRNSSNYNDTNNKMACIRLAMQSQHREVLTLLHAGHLFS